MRIELSEALSSELYELTFCLNADWLKKWNMVTLNFPNGRVISYGCNPGQVGSGLALKLDVSEIFNKKQSID